MFCFFSFERTNGRYCIFPRSLFGKGFGSGDTRTCLSQEDSFLYGPAAPADVFPDVPPDILP